MSFGAAQSHVLLFVAFRVNILLLPSVVSRLVFSMYLDSLRLNLPSILCNAISFTLRFAVFFCLWLLMQNGLGLYICSSLRKDADPLGCSTECFGKLHQLNIGDLS